MRLILSVCILVLTISCTKKQTTSSPQADTLKINITTEPQSLDWSFVADGVANEVILNITEGLVRYDLYDEKLKLIPTLATSWEPKSNGSLWEFKIREGVKWTDGVPFTPQHVLDGFERSLNPKTASQYAFVLFFIKNAREYNSGKIKDFNKVGVRLKGRNVVQFELSRPVAFFPSVLTLPVSFPVRKDLIEKHASKWTEPSNLQTLGPYKLKSWEHDKLIVLERNDSYWGTPAKIKNIFFYMISEPATALNLFESGQLDYIGSFPRTEYERLKKTPEFRATATPTLSYLGFNIKQKPFDDVRVRRALAHALDRELILKALNNGELGIKSWIPEGFLGHDPNAGLETNLDLARKLLEEAGIKKGSKLVIDFNSGESSQKIGENLQAQFKKNLGLEVELRLQEWKVYLDRLTHNALPFFHLGWLADYQDPDTYMSLFLSDSDGNHTNWKSKTYDSLVTRAASELDANKRRVLYDKAQNLLLEQDAVIIPLVVLSRNSLVSGRVRNIPHSIMGSSRYDQAEIKRD